MSVASFWMPKRLKPNKCSKSPAPVDIADAGLKHLCVHLADQSEVQALTPDFQKLATPA